jgi:hypothetical protein
VAIHAKLAGQGTQATQVPEVMPDSSDHRSIELGKRIQLRRVLAQASDIHDSPEPILDGEIEEA